MQKTLLLKQSDIKNFIKMKEVIDVVETAFKAFALRDVQMPAKEYLFSVMEICESCPVMFRAKKKLELNVLVYIHKIPLNKNYLQLWPL